MKKEEYNYILFADYFQFYIQDEQVEGDLSDSWTEQATKDMLALSIGMIGIGTVRNMKVPVKLEVHNEEPIDNIDEWDHITECSIEIHSGKLVIAGSTDYFLEAERINIKPGVYGVRIYYGNLNSLSEDGLEGNDHYRIVCWPNSIREIKVLKRYNADITKLD